MKQKSNLKIGADSSGKRLDILCSEMFSDISRSRIKSLIQAGNILVNGRIVKAGYSVKEGDLLDISVPEPIKTDITPDDIPIKILYEDAYLLVVDKNAGMVVHPATGNYSGTLVNALLYHIKDLSGIGGELKPGIVHRLDKDTSGLLLVAKNDKAHIGLSEQIKSKSAQRFYKAIIIGDIPDNEGLLSFPIGRSPADRKKMTVKYKGGREAHTKYKVLERFGKYTFLEVQLLTGRTHQIRVHFSHIGYPILGDSDYKGRSIPTESFGKDELDLWRRLLKILSRQALHAYKLKFEHPITGKTITISSPLPEDISIALNEIRKFYAPKTSNDTELGKLR